MASANHIIEQEMLTWSPAERVALAEALMESVDYFTTESLNRAWRTEVTVRVNDIESGKEPGVDWRKFSPKPAGN